MKMRDLAKWQIVSMFATGIAQFVGIIQSALIFRILTPAEWGLVQLGMSIGGALGIYQHLGLVSASTREISSAKDDEEVFKVFVTSTVVRYFVTLPMAIGLLLGAKFIALGIYGRYELITPVRIYGVTLLFQGVQGILNSVISGTKRFRQLFVYQVAIAILSVVFYIPLIYFYKVSGYFYALLCFNIVSSVSLAFLAFKPLKGHLVFPSKKDFARLFRDIFSISIAIYAVKILYTNWVNSGNLLLGLSLKDSDIAVYSAGLLFAKKLLSVSDSITTVNLPVLSEKFVKNISEFKKLFSSNFDKIFVLIVGVSVFSSFWSAQLVGLLTGRSEYSPALKLIPPLVMALILYSVINITKSSVLIPAKMAREMIGGFVLLIVSTFGAFFGLTIFFHPLVSMAWAMLFGALVSWGYFLAIIYYRLSLRFFKLGHWLLLLEGVAIAFSGGVTFLFAKVLLFGVYALLFYAFTRISGLVTKKDINVIILLLSGMRRRSL